MIQRRRERNINSKGEIWKQTESHRGKDIKTGIPHETSIKQGKKTNNENQNKKKGKKRNKIYLGKYIFQISHRQGLRLRT